MDPLTHTLVGANLASTRLGKTTRLAAPALVIGANLPDIDVLAVVGGGDAALGFRRGLTHGVPALVLLPALFAAVLWLWSRRWPETRRSEISGPWLTTLCYLGVATHPALDWLNTYGMRWWLPFNDSWSYGDSVFIIDPWLWLALGGSWLLTRRPTRGLSIAFIATTALLLLVVTTRAPRYLPVVGVAAALLLAALLRKLPQRGSAARRLPAAALISSALYIAGMVWPHGATERSVRQTLAPRFRPAHDELMVGPMPANPLRWEVVFLDREGRYRIGGFDWRDRGLTLSELRLPAAERSWLEEIGGERIPGFLRWTRFPWVEQESPAPDGKIYVMDARYARRRTTGFGGAAIE